MDNLVSASQAIDKIRKTAHIMLVIERTLGKATGYVLAENIKAKTTLPPLNSSAMDGYAITAVDIPAPGERFHVIGESLAGKPFAGNVEKGEAIRIFTGGAVPKGINRIIIQENVKRIGDDIIVTGWGSSGPHIRLAGQDFKTGQVIAKAGSQIDAYIATLIASANHKVAKIYAKPKLALLANGNELVAPGHKLSAGQIVSSNPYGLGLLAREWGADILDMGISNDNPASIRQQIAKCADADILLPIGGASVGDHDHMRAVFHALGFKKVFAKVAVKPGKPTWFGKLGNQYVLGLPGNPASALVCAHIFLRPLIFALTGNRKNAHPLISARTTEPLRANGRRAEYLRARATVTNSGQLNVTPFARQDSALISPFLKANCFLYRPVQSENVNPGDPVKILPIGLIS